MQEFQHHTFGAEFETIAPYAAGFSNLHQVAEALARHSGLTVTASNRHHTPDTTTFRVVSDISVRGPGVSAEIVTPILRGADGFAKVEKILAAARHIGLTVNDSAGLHVHVGKVRTDLDFFKNLVKITTKYQSAIDTVHPQHRRGANPYTRSNRNATAAAIDAAQSLPELIRVNTGEPADSHTARYYKLNLTAYRKHRTVEFRQHAGTIDTAEAINWIKTCIRIVIAATANKTGAPRVAPTSFDHLTDAKTRRVAEYISRPEGATRQEIIAGTDFAALSVNRQARLAGITVQTVRTRGVDRFYAVQVATVDAPATLATFSDLIEHATTERAFYAVRAQIHATR